MSLLFGRRVVVCAIKSSKFDSLRYLQGALVRILFDMVLILLSLVFNTRRQQLIYKLTL